MTGFDRRPVPRLATAPASAIGADRRAALSRAGAELLDLASRVVDELIRQAADPVLSLAERRGLVSIAIKVDRRAAWRAGVPPHTVEVAACGRAALGRVREAAA